jgi:hypothetical protein
MYIVPLITTNYATVFLSRLLIHLEKNKIKYNNQPFKHMGEGEYFCKKLKRKGEGASTNDYKKKYTNILRTHTHSVRYCQVPGHIHTGVR